MLYNSRRGAFFKNQKSSDPNDLRDCVEAAIERVIEPTAWERCDRVNRAEQQSPRTILKGWKSI
jgi:hypothetical protein